MKHTPTADTRSPWYEAFAPAVDAAGTQWLRGTKFPAAPAEAEAATGGGAETRPAQEEAWATEALFDYYNG